MRDPEQPAQDAVKLRSDVQRSALAYGIEIGRELGEIDAAIRHMRATGANNNDVCHHVEHLKRRAQNLVRVLTQLYGAGLD